MIGILQSFGDYLYNLQCVKDAIIICGLQKNGPLVSRGTVND